MTEPRCCYDPVSLTCPTCGHVALRLPTYRTCRPVPAVIVPRPKRFMLGDFVERCLTAVGVTRARAEKWTRTAGTSGGCGCDNRKKWLNDFGMRFQA